jgi:RNA polymerase sigma-70 factor (ECF subfamily)
MAQRARLLGLAYRLLGSAEDAEDAVQDAFLRWDRVDRGAIAAPSAWLAKVVTNLCLNRLASAQAKREVYPGPWLPDPVLTEGGDLGPMETAAQRDSVSMALLVLLERLTPAERAVFVLREAFGYRHGEIAELLETSETNCRQMHRRARQRISEQRPRFQPAPGRWRPLVERFLAAAGEGDLPALEQLLAADVISWADGGGKVTAARRPVVGSGRVARYITGAIRRFGAGVQGRPAEINGQPGVLGLADGALAGVLVLEAGGGTIASIRIVANPDKLGFAARQAGLSHPAGLPGS